MRLLEKGEILVVLLLHYDFSLLGFGEVGQMQTLFPKPHPHFVSQVSSKVKKEEKVALPWV